MFTRQQKQRAMALLNEVQNLEEDATALQPLGFVARTGQPTQDQVMEQRDNEENSALSEPQPRPGQCTDVNCTSPYRGHFVDGLAGLRVRRNYCSTVN